MISLSPKGGAAIAVNQIEDVLPVSSVLNVTNTKCQETLFMMLKSQYLVYASLGVNIGTRLTLLQLLLYK